MFYFLQAEALTGIADPVFSAKALLEKGENTKWVIVKMGERGCLMITTQGIYQVPAFKVIIDVHHDYLNEENMIETLIVFTKRNMLNRQ